MPIDYILGDKKFLLNYRELREHHNSMCQMSDAEFIDNLPNAIHLACVICFLKDIPTYVCLSDIGIVHELAHLMTQGGTTTDLQDIRELFKTSLYLS